MPLVIDILHYRLLQEWRQAIQTSSWRRLKLLLLIMTPALGLVILGNYFAVLVQAAKATLQSEPARREGVLSFALLVAGALTFLVSFTESLQQIWFAKDQEMLAIAPVSAHTCIGYRIFFAAVRSSAWVLGFMPLPVLVVASLPAEGSGSIILAILLLALCWVWLSLAAFSLASFVSAAANHWCLGRHGLFVFIYLLQIGAMGFIFLNFLTPGRWPAVAGNCWDGGLFLLLPHRQVASCLVHYQGEGIAMWGLRVLFLAATLLITSFAFYSSTVRIWSWANRAALPSRRMPRALWARGNGLLFSSNRSWAMFQKDRKDLLRSPVYRNCLIATLLLLLVGIWQQGRSQASKGPLTMTLALMYMSPLIISARAVSLEAPLLGFYRMVLPRSYRLLDAKLRVHGIVNTIATLVVATPFFLVMGHGPSWWEIPYFFAAAVVYVPLLTALALALGAYFPDPACTPGVLGMRLPGVLIYGLLAATLYSLLLNRMIIGAAAYSVFLLGGTAVLYSHAREHFYSLIERRVK